MHTEQIFCSALHTSIQFSTLKYCYIVILLYCANSPEMYNLHNLADGRFVTEYISPVGGRQGGSRRGAQIMIINMKPTLLNKKCKV